MDIHPPHADRAARAIARIVASLAPRAEVRRAILFGSRARGDYQPRSDIDLAVDAPNASPSEWHAIADIVADADTLLPIDLVRLDEAPPELRARIDAEGQVLLER